MSNKPKFFDEPDKIEDSSFDYDDNDIKAKKKKKTVTVLVAKQDDGEVLDVGGVVGK